MISDISSRVGHEEFMPNNRRRRRSIRQPPPEAEEAPRAAAAAVISGTGQRCPVPPAALLLEVGGVSEPALHVLESLLRRLGPQQRCDDFLLDYRVVACRPGGLRVE